MERYHYTECGLDNVYLLSGFELETVDGEEELFIHDIHGLHRAIGHIVATKTEPLKGAEIRYLRHMMNMSQTRLGDFLGVTYQTVLLWEKGDPISKTAENYLRTIYMAWSNPEDTEVFEGIKARTDLDAEEMVTEREITMTEESSTWREAA